MVQYTFQTDYEWDAYINKYDLFKEDILKKYGEPDVSEFNYDRSLEAGTALWLGRYAQRDIWQLKNMEVTMFLVNLDGTITLVVYYESKEYL